VRLICKVTDVKTRKSHVGYFASLLYLKNNWFNALLFNHLCAKESKDIIQTNTLQTSRFDLICSIAVLIVYLTSFPFYLIWRISDT